MATNAFANPVLEQPQDQQPAQPIANLFNANPTDNVGVPPQPANLSQPTQFLTGVQQVPNPGGDPWSVGFDSVDHDPFTPQTGLYKS